MQLKIIFCLNFSDCEIKEPNNLVKEELLVREIYETTCTICGLDPYYVQQILWYITFSIWSIFH